MINEAFKRVLDNTPKEDEIFVRLYGDIVVRINQILKDKGYNQRNLAQKMNKKPSEINKWLNGQHNFTLKSISKLEAELGERILYVPQKKEFDNKQESKTTFTVYNSVKQPEENFTHTKKYGKLSDVRSNKETNSREDNAA